MDFIEKHCIVGDIKMDEVSVDQDVPDADGRVVGADTEDTSDNEGTIRYDLVFDAQVPRTGEMSLKMDLLNDAGQDKAIEQVELLVPRRSNSAPINTEVQASSAFMW